jgi:cysteine synthase A
MRRWAPGCRFGAPACPRPGPARSAVVELDRAAERFVAETIKTVPVVLFTLEWSEFSWSARKLFSGMGIEFLGVDLDSVAYQENDRGGKIRAVLAREAGSSTIPQVYVAGRLIGGCAELFGAFNDGSLVRLLEENRIALGAGARIDTRDLLPKWVHPRKSA